MRKCQQSGARDSGGADRLRSATDSGYELTQSRSDNDEGAGSGLRPHSEISRGEDWETILLRLQKQTLVQSSSADHRKAIVERREVKHVVQLAYRIRISKLIPDAF